MTEDAGPVTGAGSVQHSVAIFIDAGYLDRVLRDEFDCVKVDMRKLVDELAGEGSVVRVGYYTCAPYQSTPPTEEEWRRKAAFDRFRVALGKLNIVVTLGKLQRLLNPETGMAVFNQKRVDVALAVDLVLMAARGQTSEAVLVAGDSDFIPAIDEARRAGVRVRLFHGKSAHTELKVSVDSARRVNRKFLERVRRA